MELAQVYMNIWRKDPVRMKWHIQKITEEITKIVEVYSANLQASFALKRDLKEMINNYLRNNKIDDLFTFSLYEETKGWTGIRLKVDVKFKYERVEIA